MRRLHLFELEDFPWFPITIRDLATDYLRFVQALLAIEDTIVPLLVTALNQSPVAQVVDLCSGGGGPVVAVLEALSAEGVSIRFTLTDRYPNLSAFRRLALQHPARISFCTDAVDAAKVPRTLPGLRTLFNAFHHFDPAGARAVLADAVDAGQAIAIFEIPERVLSTMIPILFTPLFVAAVTPFIRPFEWRRLLWTYVLPLVPATCLWDGIVSQWRAYTPGEMLALTDGLGGYRWKAGQVRIGKSFGRLTYMVGSPAPPE